MKPLETITAVVDPDARGDAGRIQGSLVRGLEVAECSGAHLSLVTRPPQTIEDTGLDANQDWLADLANRLGDSGYRVSPGYLLDASLAAGVERAAARAESDLIIKPVESDSVWREVRNLGQDNRLLRNTRIPILFARCRHMSRQPRNVAALELPGDEPAAPLDVAVLQAAQAMAGLFDGVVSVEHVVAPTPLVPPTDPTGAGAVMPPPDPQRTEALLGAGRARLEGFLARHAAAAVPHQVNAGEVWAVLPERARELDADLLVMGSHTRGWLANLVAGAHVESTLRHARCDLLVVPARAGHGAA